MGSVTPGEQFARQQHGIARLPLAHDFGGDLVEIDAAHALAHLPGDFRPVVEFRRRQFGSTAAIESEMDVARRRTVGDDGDRLVGGVGRVILDLDIEHRRQTTQPLGTDTALIDLLEQLETQLLGPIAGATSLQCLNIDGIQQRFLRQLHRLFRRPADADTQHARRTPACSHLGQLLQNPVDDAIRRIEHGELGFRFTTAALGGDMNLHRIAWHQLVMNDRRRVVAGVPALAIGIGQH